MARDISSVVITGMGAITALGLGVPVLFQSLINGHSRFAVSNRFPILTFPLVAAELQDFDFENALQQQTKMPKETIARAQKVGLRAPLALQNSLIVALEAYADAQLYARKIEGSRLGIVVGGHNLSQAYQYKLQSSFTEQPNYFPPRYALHFMDTDQVGTLSEVFGIHGEGFTVGGASASGNVALIHAFRLIKQKIVDVCMVVGALADLSPLELQGFYNIGALGGQGYQQNPSKACRPFDQDHNGFIWGQSCGCIILESASKACSDGVHIYGEIGGTFLGLDGNRLPDPCQDGERKAMQGALDSAQKSVADLQYINTHGSSSPLGDTTEIAAIRSFLGDHTEKVSLNSTKSIVGHGLWSAGVIEAIATLLQMENGFVHANLNLEHPIDSECKFVGKKPEQCVIKHALSNSFGFGGINTSILFSKFEA